MRFFLKKKADQSFDNSVFIAWLNILLMWASWIRFEVIIDNFFPQKIMEIIFVEWFIMVEISFPIGSTVKPEN